MNLAIQERAKKIIAVVYIAIITLTFYSDTMLPKIASMLIIPIAFIIFLIRADFDRVKRICVFPLFMIAGLLIVYVLSVIVWIINIEQSMYIMVGTERVLFQIINVLVAFSAVYVFGEDAVKYTLFGAFCMNSIRFLQAFAIYGPVQSFMAIVHAITTGEQTGFMTRMEIHVVSYVYGIFILYYIFLSRENIKKKTIYIALSVMFIILGFKRIIFASTPLVVLVGLLWFKCKPKLKKNYGLVIGIVVAVLSFLYIPFIRSGMFEATMNRFNIETNTRIDIYNFVKVIYEFSPDFIGRGIDYVVRYLEYIKTLHLEFRGSSLNYIHNDILVRYIEMGFLGFCGWLYANCIFIERWIAKNYGALFGVLYACINAYCFINFSVGNTNHAYAVRLCVAVVIMGGVHLCEENIQKGNNDGQEAV